MYDRASKPTHYEDLAQIVTAFPPVQVFSVDMVSGRNVVQWQTNLGGGKAQSARKKCIRKKFPEILRRNGAFRTGRQWGLQWSDRHSCRKCLGSFLLFQTNANCFLARNGPDATVPIMK